jgi:hypothetical protein
MMSRFDQMGLRRFTARDGLVAIGVAAVLLVLFAGGSIRKAGEEMRPGVGRTFVLAIGRPAGWVADTFGLAPVARSATAWLSPDEDLGGSGSGFASTTTGSGSEVPPVTPDAFDPTTLGQKAPPKKPLETLLVTGDSLSTPLDTEVARSLAGSDVKVVRDPHVGTGISNSAIVDWAKLSSRQAKDKPDAVVVFIGANEGYPLPKPGGSGQIKCCSADWAAVYASRARQMMNTYRRDGASKVYWLTIPTPRDPDRQEIARTVNAAVLVAAQPWRSQVRVVDTIAIFTPDAKYRAAMDIDGEETIVRESDGIHLNRAGSKLLAGLVLDRVALDFTR